MSVSEPMPPSGSGESIGGYQILEVLGQGGMGEVFLAWDERLQRRVAIKRIRHDGEITPTLRQRLLREAQAVASLSHPAIVHVYELLKDDAGDDCIVMEHVEGRTVAAALLAGPLEPLTAVRLAMEIAAGLAAAHEAGIVHRDLKAENVIVTPSGHAKILDFGLAKPLVPADGDPTLTMSGLVLGTCRSMSPEQAKGAEVDGRSDLFSLGVLLYEMLTGQPPFCGSGALEVLTQVISKDPPRVDAIRPAVSPRLGTLIERLLEKEPASRPHSAAEVVRELEAIEVATGSSPVLSCEETISELPTGFTPLSEPLPKAGAVPASTAEVALPSHDHQRLRIAVLIALGVAVLAAGVVLFRILKQRPASETPRSTVHQSPPPVQPVRPDSPPPKVRRKDYERFLEIRRNLFKRPAQESLAQLDAVLATSPEFSEARLLAGELCLTEFYSTKDTQFLDRAEKEAKNAQALAPGDAAPLVLKCKAEIARGLMEDAKNTLEQIQSLNPGDPPLLLRSLIAERSGDREEALADLRQLVKQHPSQQSLYRLADLEARTGHITDAQKHLKELLTRFPESLWAHEKQATFELTYGAATKAETLFRELIAKAPQRACYTNLGIALIFQGDYGQARSALKTAQSLEPDDPAVNIDLADVELALGNEKMADTLYDEALQRLDTRLLGASLSPVQHTMRAQCLAHLGRTPEARREIEQALKADPDDGDILQAAALVYAVMRERKLTIDIIGKALEKDVQPRWFQLPAYDWLKNDPDYKRLMTKAGGHP